MKQWHAVYVASRQEKKVNQALQRKGMETFLPLNKTLRSWSDRKKIVELPLLPGYVFAHIEQNDRDMVLNTPGVVSFVKSAGKIGVVYEHEINALKQLIEHGYHLDAFPAEKISSGDKVEISSGALKNLQGVVIEESGESFFNIFLEGIGYNIRVKLPAGILKKFA